MIDMLSKKETRRKFFHMLSGTVLSILVYIKILDTWGLLVLFLLALAVSLISRKYKLPLLLWALKNLERDYAIKKFPGKGVVYFLAGSVVTVALFGTQTGAASIIITSLGDSIAPLLGQFGRIRNPISKSKFLEGTFAGMIAGFAGAAFFVSYTTAAVASIFAMIIEGLDLRFFNTKIDDNITMPIAAGIVIRLVGF